MIEKAIISDYTWRSLEMQQAAFEGLPVFCLPEDWAILTRKTTRKEPIIYRAASLAVIAKDEAGLSEFVKFMKSQKAKIIVDDTGETYTNIKKADWQRARKEGAAKIGGQVSAERRRAISKAAVEKIRDRWPLPSKEWPTVKLLEEADVSLNTAKAYLGKRPIAQYNHQAKMKRKANAKRI